MDRRRWAGRSSGRTFVTTAKNFLRPRCDCPTTIDHQPCRDPEGAYRCTCPSFQFRPCVAIIDRKYIGGSCPNIACLPPVPGLAEAQPLTHIEALELDVVPDHLLVIGGGYVGIELAQAMRRFGSRVTILEQGERLLPRDDDVVEGLSSLLNDEGIRLVPNARIKRVMGTSGQSVRVAIEQDGAEKTLEGTHLLVAVGRTPNTDGIGLELAGRRSKRSRISQGGRAAANDG